MTRALAAQSAPAVDDFWFGPRADRSRTRLSLGLAPAAVTVVTVANLAQGQGHLAILIALSKLHSSVRQRISWLIVGPECDADYVSELKKGVVHADCDVRIIGALPMQQIRDVYGAGDLFCLVATEPSFGPANVWGAVYLEAAACGLPSIATPFGGGDVVIDNETGRVVEPSIDAIADAITELAMDGIKRVSLGKRAWMRARAMNRGGRNPGRAPLPHNTRLPRDIGLAHWSSAAGETK